MQRRFCRVKERYDTVVAGGSVAGLAFAAEAARRGMRVVVCEEHAEVGEPEKCDGLVGLRGLRQRGFPPDPEVIQGSISSATVHSASGRSLSLDAAGLEVVVLDRSAYDKQLARRALDAGAELRLGTRVSRHTESLRGVTVAARGASLEAEYIVDATGPTPGQRPGILPAAKYEVEADWVEEGRVEVYLDADRYPAFFAWVIPYGGRLAKVGAAGRGIDPFQALDSFLASRPCRVLRRIPAPIYVGGPSAEFVTGRTVRVGESAGQVKPTTAGGITTSIAGAVLAAGAVGDAVLSGDPSALGAYRRGWEKEYGKEMRSMSRLRGIFEKLSNSDIESAISTVGSSGLRGRMAAADFDHHASALLAALGVRGLLKIARVVASAEAKALLSSAASS